MDLPEERGHKPEFGGLSRAVRYDLVQLSFVAVPGAVLMQGSIFTLSTEARLIVGLWGTTRALWRDSLLQSWTVQCCKCDNKRSCRRSPPDRQDKQTRMSRKAPTLPSKWLVRSRELNVLTTTPRNKHKDCIFSLPIFDGKTAVFRGTSNNQTQGA